MDNKLLVFDCDGTLLDSNHQVRKQNIIALEKAHKLGCDIAIATGRGFEQIQFILKQMPFIQYAACLNGAIVYNCHNKHEHLIAKPLGMDIVNDAIKIAQHYQREIYWVSKNELYHVYFGKNPKTDIDDELYFKSGVPDPIYNDWEDAKDKLNINILQMAIKTERKFVHEIVESLVKKYKSKYSIHLSSNCYIDINSSGVTKAKALKYIQKQLNYNKDNTYAFGDSGNDISMFIENAIGVVMGNALDNIKSYGKYVIDSNDTDAIADFINKIL